MSDDAALSHASETVVDAQGRVTIPAQLRREAGLDVGSRVVVYVEDGRVVLETRQQLARRIQRDVRAALADGPSMVEELLAERRAEAGHHGLGGREARQRRGRSGTRQ